MTELDNLTQQTSVLVAAVQCQAEALLDAPIPDRLRLACNLSDLAARARASTQDWLDHPRSIDRIERRKMTELAAYLDSILSMTNTTLQGVARFGPKA